MQVLLAAFILNFLQPLEAVLFVNNNVTSNYKVASIGSGSKGNGTLVSTDKVTVLVDCGFGLKESVSRLNRLNLSPEDLDGVLVTHEHQDHIKGVGPLCRKYNIPIWCSKGSYLSGKLGQVENVNFIKGSNSFSIGDLDILPLTVPHDAREPCQFAFEYEAIRLAVLSDLGSFSTNIIKQLDSINAILLEFNHDEDMLWDGDYPLHLKRRVGGALGHLSNQQSKQMLEKINSDALKLIVATHLSSKNNCPLKVESCLLETLDSKSQKIVIANQEQGFDWMEISALNK